VKDNGEMKMMKQILAMGGGGFSMEPDNLALDRFLLSLSNKNKPEICFIGTASGDSPDYIDRFYKSMKELNCEPSHLSLYSAPEGDLRDFILDKDIIYVGGGNTRNLLALWKEWNLDVYLKEAYDNGVVMAGISAGSICWFEEGVTDSIPGKLTSLNCLGFLKGSNCPHYDGESERRASYHRLLKDGMKSGIACDDGVAAYFIDGVISRYVSSRKESLSYSVSYDGGLIIETKIHPDFLN
jgi:peptidase E